jgi:hypothetical protein
MKIIYLKIAVSNDIVIKDFLAAIGNNVEAPLADKKVGLNLLADRCEHRQHKSKNENALLGVCFIKTDVYIYALVPDHGDNPQRYLMSSDIAETLSKVRQYQKNAEAYLKEKHVANKLEGFYVADKLKFMHMLDNEAEK